MSARTALLTLCAAVAAVFAGGSPALAADPVEDALRVRDVYVAPRTVGPRLAEARERLQEVARQLASRRQPVKIAIVVGPAGAPSLRVYARRLRVALDFEGTLVVTAPRSTTVALGPRAPAAITRDFRTERVPAIADPVERAARAAEVAVGPEPPDAGGSGLRGISALLGLAVLGGAWAAAWGLRRERRNATMALADSRALMRLRFDALRSRARVIGARPDLDVECRGLVTTALGAYSDGIVALDRATTLEELRRAEPALQRGQDALAQCAQTLGEPLDPDSPFEGLCAVDPGHGGATATATLEDDGEVAVCADCARALSAGETRARRTVPVDGRPVPFDEAPLPVHLGAGAPPEA